MTAPPPDDAGALQAVLPAAWRQGARWQLLMPPKGTDDDPAKLLLSDPQGKPQGVLLLSQAGAPDLVAGGIAHAEAARACLPSPLAGTVLQPMTQGELDGRSFALLPYRHPLPGAGWRRRAARLWFGGPVLDWLAEVTAATMRPCSVNDFESLFARPLAAILTDEEMPGELQEAAAQALDDLARGRWQPHTVLMHGDFWEGNLLQADDGDLPALTKRRQQFLVIDWPTSRTEGHPVYDLLRMTRSLRTPLARQRRELARHAQLLSCRPEDLRSYLLAHAGWLGQRLGCYSRERYLHATQALDRQLQQVLG